MVNGLMPGGKMSGEDRLNGAMRGHDPKDLSQD